MIVNCLACSDWLVLVITFFSLFFKIEGVFFPKIHLKMLFPWILQDLHEVYMKTPGVITKAMWLQIIIIIITFFSKHLFSIYFFFLKVTALKCLVYQMLYCFQHQSLLKLHQCYQSWNWVVPYHVPQIQARWIQKINIIRHSSHQLIFTGDIGTS